MSLLLEILEEKSPLYIGDHTFYFKHMTALELLRIERVYEDSVNLSSSLGIKTRKEMVDEAIEAGRWDKRKEEEEKALLYQIEKLEKQIEVVEEEFDGKIEGLKRIQLSPLELQIKKLRDDITRIDEQRAVFCEGSAEEMADQLRTQAILRGTLFCDESLSSSLLDNFQRHQRRLPAIFEEMRKKQVELNSRPKLLATAYAPSFFNIFIALSESPEYIFKKSGVEMTLPQRDLLTYAKVLYNKLTNYPDIPEKDRTNPIALYNYKPQKTAKGGFNSNMSVGKFGQSLNDLKAKTVG